MALNLVVVFLLCGGSYTTESEIRVYVHTALMNVCTYIRTYSAGAIDCAHAADIIQYTWSFQPEQKVSPAFRKCECFVMLMEAIWIKVRSAANRVGTWAIFVTAHPRLRCMRTTFLKPSPMSGKLNWGGKFLLMCKSFERKGLHSTATGTVDDIDALSWIGCISVLEVFRLSRKVVAYRHSRPLHDFRRLVLHAQFSECWQRFAGPLEMGLRP